MGHQYKVNHLPWLLVLLYKILVVNQITIPETENWEYDDHPSFVIELITDQSEIDIRKFTIDNDDF